MKHFKLVVAFVTLAFSPTSSYAVALTPDIRSIVFFLDDSYEEVGQWISYCDGTSVVTGQWTYRHRDEAYSCPE